MWESRRVEAAKRYLEYSAVLHTGIPLARSMESMEKEQLLQLQAFIELCRHKPEVLHKQELAFFKSYLESLGARIPLPPQPKPTPKENVPPAEGSSSEDIEPETPESEESEIELDNSGVIEPDNDEPLDIGDASVEPTDEMLEESCEKRSQAMELQTEGKLEESVKLWTEAIVKNPSSAILFAKRANVLLKLEKPNAAIRDANRALELNPDQALAYKIRGRANRLLGNWEDAAKDLAMACKLDYTDEANDWLKEVMPNAKKLQEHKRKWERKLEERELRERAERVRKAREAHRNAAQQQSQDDDDLGGMPGGFPGNFFPGGIGDCFQDPEIIAALQDPEVAAAFQDITQNPANIAKYQANPKIKNIMTKMAMKMGASAPPPPPM